MSKIEDFLVLFGLLLIFGTSFLINVYFGSYLLGIFSLFIAGVIAKRGNTK